MMSRLPLFLIALLALLPPTAHAQGSDIPEFGEGAAVSLNQEYYLGRAWLMSFRRQAPILDDPLLHDYVESLVYRLAATSQLKELRLEIVVVKNPTINAFAVPGGIVGVHNGLIAKAETEAQLSSVLAHELAHLSQRHFARGLEAQKRSSAASMAGLLGGLVAIAAGAGDAGMAAIMSGQAAALDSMLRYSRAHEQEADRIGMQNQVAAGLDPGGAAGMFEVMMRDSRKFGERPPEFLLTHPVTESRIADARNRAGQYPRQIFEDNPEFQLMRARVELSFIKSDNEAVTHFRHRREAGGKGAVAAQYGLILALTRKGDYSEALELLKPMREFAPTNIPYGLAEVDILLGQQRYDEAIAQLEKALALVPDNHPISMTLGNAYFRGGYYAKADTLLSHHARSHPSDEHLWYLLAEVQGKARNILGLHQSRAEYFALNGAMDKAIEHLDLALPLARDQVTEQRILERKDYFRKIEIALKDMQSGR